MLFKNDVARAEAHVFDDMYATIAKEDFTRPIWFSGAKLIDSDMVNTPYKFNPELARKAIGYARMIE